MKRLALAAIVVGSIVLAACGGSSATATPKPAAATATSVPGKAIKLESAVLQQSEAPAGFTSNGQKTQDNQAAANDTSDPPTMLKNFQTWGRITGYSVTFTRSSSKGDEEIDSEAELYQAASGLKDAFAYERQNAKAELQALLGNNGTLVSYNEVSGPSVGDETFMAVAKISLKQGNTQVTLDAVDVSWRHGNVAADVVWISQGPAIVQSDVIALAQKQDAHIKAALAA